MPHEAKKAIPRKRMVTPKIGFHAPIKGGVHNALIVAKDTGCDTVQLFSRNPRGWMAKPLTLEDVVLFRKTRRATKISPVLIHCNYLVNLAASDDVMLQKSRQSFREEVERALLLGADYLVVHPGSSRGACETDGIALCAASLLIACKGLKFGSLRILLENTAGQGECIGHRFEHLREIMNACPKLPLGVCFDTAHAFTAGYDIREADGLEALLQRVQKTVGIKNVRAIHFNDSRAVYNSRVDRHWHIGEGHIGTDALRRVAQHPKLKHAAFILETPYDDPRADVKNLALLRSFVSERTRMNADLD
ncbi:MAG TPA: deoxyribonuclease IV [Pyrinomonadaceae bacterium]|nr:deoxyribonuclease IV [Pyrinomonadaceae bacterium]